MQNGGSHPSTLEDSATSTLLLFNPTAMSNRVDVRIAAGGKLWLRRYQLEAFETKAINIGEVVASGEKGDNGQALPKEATFGEVNWSTVNAGEGFGRLLVSQRERSLARNFSCGSQIEACSSYLDNGYLGISDPGSGSMGPLVVTFCIGATACTGQNDYSSNENGSWSSYNTGIASVPAGPSSSGTVSAVSAGSAGILSQANFNGCQAESTGTANVAPSVMGLSPNAAVVGQKASLTITGSGFGPSPSVAIGGLPVTIQGTPTNSSIAVQVDLTNVTTQGVFDVVVTADGQASDKGPQDKFTAQVPHSLVYVTYQGSGPSSPCTNGICPLQTPNNGSFYLPNGTIAKSGVCGVGRYYTFNIVDASKDPLVGTSFSLTETPTAFSSTINNLPEPPAKTFSNVGGLVADIQALFYSSPQPPACLGSNDNETVTFSYSVSNGGHSYPLTTVLKAFIGNSNGTSQVTETIQTP